MTVTDHSPDVVEHPVTADDPAAHDAPEAQDEHDDVLASTFGQAVLRGYAGGFVVFGVIAFLIARYAAPSLPLSALIGIGVGVGFWIGIMGGVIAVGLWSTKHEHELFHHG